ncbi:MAG: 3-(3-hydroxy-phenyl)propionate transporter MhpT [Steroidobacteraceae bacterium]
MPAQSRMDTRAKTGLTVALCFVVALMEGVDLQSAGIAAPKMRPAFGLSQQLLSFVLSASTFGLLIGALIGGRLADYIGRKRALLVSVMVFGAFSLGTTFAWDSNSLLALRLLTGLGLGGAMPNMIALVSENSRAERRGLVLALMYCGMPLGGSLASLVSVFDIGDWRAVFYFGGVAPLLATPLLWVLLPESQGFASLGAGTQQTALRPGSFGHALFAEGRAAPTILLWLSYGLTLLVLYLLLSWLPTLLVSRGLSKPDAGLAQFGFNIGGALGAVGIGWLMDRGRRWLTVLLTYAAMIAALQLLAGTPPRLETALLYATLVGATIVGAQAIIYATAPACYALGFRGTGLGAVIAAGRAGSVLGPLVAGQLLGSGQSPQQVLSNMVPVLLAGGVSAMLLVGRRASATPAST